MKHVRTQIETRLAGCKFGRISRKLNKERSGVRNIAKCNKCGGIIESHHVHDYRTCPCGSISVDGGQEYIRRGGDPEDFDREFDIAHGFMPQERKVGNYFIVDLTLVAPLEKAVESDNLEDTINYAAVYEVVKNQMDIPSNLIEHVGGRIIRTLKERFSQLMEVELKLSKLNPPFNGDIYSASVILNEQFN